MSKNEKQRDLLSPYSKWLKWIVLSLGILLYANTLDHQYALDDYSIIIEHQHVQAGTEGIGAILTTNYRHGQGGFNDGLYRPLSLVTFAIEKSWFKGNTSIAHLLNVLLYSFGLLFLFLSLQKVFEDRILLLPFGICLLFAAHPLHTEVVANIKSRDELLVFFGFGLALWSLLKMETDKKYALPAVIGCLISLFSKESSVLYLGMIPLLFLLQNGKKVKDALPSLVTILPLILLFIAIRASVLGSMENPVDEGITGLLNNPIAGTEDSTLRWGSTFALQLLFALKLLFPIELIHDYSYNQIPLVPILSIQSLIGIVILLALVLLSIKGTLEKRNWAWMILAYLLSIALASQILLLLGIQFAERMLFLTVLPFSMLLLYAAMKLIWKRETWMNIQAQKKLLYFIIILTGIYSFKTINRNADWKDNLTLYSADINAASQSARANYNLGTSLSGQADLYNSPIQKNQVLDQAVNYLSKAVEIYPDYLDAWNNLGIAYKKAGNLEAATKVYEKNILRDPNYSKNYYNLGTAYYQMGEYRKTIMAMSEYTQRVPNSPDAYMIMAQSAGRLNSFEEAVSWLNVYLQYRPNESDAYNMLGMAYGSLNQFENAEQSFMNALNLSPNRADVWFNRAINYNRQGKTALEVDALKKVVEIQPGNQGALNQLISILESNGRSEEASKYRNYLR